MSLYTQRYAKLVLPDTARCFGMELEPLTIGHCLLMWRIGSPIARGRVLGTGNLVVALYVLTRPWEVAAEGLKKKRIRRLLKAWGWQMRWFVSANRRIAVKQVLEDWINAWWDEPDMWNEEVPEGNGCNAPYLQSLKVRLMSNLKISPKEALNYPVALALWDLAAYTEDQGGSQFVSEEDAAAIDKALGVAHG